MSNQSVKVGELIDDKQQRDAILIAIAPVRAGGRLAPGEPVGFVTSSTEIVGRCSSPIGVVDPFLKAPVFEGERFYLWLFPNTVTSLRHQWTHPAFAVEYAPAAPVVDAVRESTEWIAKFAAEIGQSSAALMDAAEGWDRFEKYTYDNSESYKDVEYEKWALFWQHYKVVTGKNLTYGGEASFFTCSC